MVKLRHAAAPDLPDLSSEDEDTCSTDEDEGSWCSTAQDSLSDIEELSEEADQDAEDQHAEQETNKQPISGTKVHQEQAASTPRPAAAASPSPPTAAAEQSQEDCHGLGGIFNNFAALDGMWSDSDGSASEQDEHVAHEQQDGISNNRQQQQQQQQGGDEPCSRGLRQEDTDSTSMQPLHTRRASDASLPSLEAGSESDLEDIEPYVPMHSAAEAGARSDWGSVQAATQGAAPLVRGSSFDSLPLLAGTSDAGSVPDLVCSGSASEASHSEPGSPRAVHGHAARPDEATTVHSTVSTGSNPPGQLALHDPHSSSDADEPPNLLEQSESDDLESDDDDSWAAWQPSLRSTVQSLGRPSNGPAQTLDGSRPRDGYGVVASQAAPPGVGQGTAHGSAPAHSQVDVQQQQQQRRQPALHQQQGVQQAAPQQPMLQLRNGMGLGLRSTAAFLPVQAEVPVQAEEATKAEGDSCTSDGPECWICFNCGPGLFSPCAICSGGLRHIHRACFSKWLSTTWAMACPNCARPYAPQVLSEFEDGRLLLSLLEQQREQARACRGASPSNGSSSDQGMLAAQLDVPYPPYSVAHFTINGAFQVCIPAENQTPTGLLRTIRSVVDSLAAEPPYLADGTRMSFASTQLGGLVIEQQEPPAYGPHGHGHGWFDGEDLYSDDEYEESDDDDDDEGEGWAVPRPRQPADILRAPIGIGERWPTLRYMAPEIYEEHASAARREQQQQHLFSLRLPNRSLLASVIAGLAEPHNYPAYNGQQEQEQQQQQGHRGGGVQRADRGVRELRRSVAFTQRRHERQVNVGRRGASMGRAMARGQRNR